MYDVMNLPEMQKRIRRFHRNQYFRTCTTVVQTDVWSDCCSSSCWAMCFSSSSWPAKSVEEFWFSWGPTAEFMSPIFSPAFAILSRSGLSLFHRIHGSLVPQNVQAHSIVDRRLAPFRCWEGIWRRQVCYQKCPHLNRNFSSVLGLVKKVPCNDHEDQFRADDTSEKVLGPRTWWALTF